MILMDISMPIMNGIEATKAIRAFEHTHNMPSTPIVALTAPAMPGDRERFLKVGADNYLTKPVKQKNRGRFG